MGSRRKYKADRPKEVIYLDSSDISRFADVERGKITDPFQIELYKTALNAVDAERAIFPASVFHLGEALRHHEDSYADANCRAAVIERISGGWCYPPPQNLFAYDIAKSIEASYGVKSRAGVLLDVEHRWSWVPSLKDILADRRFDVAADVDRIAQERGHKTSRFQRRFIRKNSLSLIGDDQREEIVKGIDKSLGLSLKAVRRPDFLSAILGRTSIVPVQRALESEIGSPTILINLEDSGEKIVNATYGPIRKMQENLAQNIEIIKIELEKAQYDGSYVQKKILTNVFKGMKIDISKSMYDKLEPMVRPLFRGVNYKKSEINFDSARFDGFLSVLAANYALDHSASLQDRRKQKSSDAGDVFHSVYALNSTIWMGDGYSADLVRRSIGAEEVEVWSDRSKLHSYLLRLLR